MTNAFFTASSLPLLELNDLKLGQYTEGAGRVDLGAQTQTPLATFYRGSSAG